VQVQQGKPAQVTHACWGSNPAFPSTLWSLVQVQQGSVGSLLRPSILFSLVQVEHREFDRVTQVTMVKLKLLPPGGEKQEENAAGCLTFQSCGPWCRWSTVV